MAALELPIDVLIGPVKSMGAVAGPESMNVFQYVVFRRLSSGSDLDVWDESSRDLVPAGNPISRHPRRSSRTCRMSRSPGRE